VRGDRLAIVPAHVVSQPEHDRRVVLKLPRLGQVRPDIQVLVVLHERREERVVVQLHVVCGGARDGVEPAEVRTHAHDDAATAVAVTAAARGEEEADGQTGSDGTSP
jgi:hypothetical protein